MYINLKDVKIWDDEFMAISIVINIFGILWLNYLMLDKVHFILSCYFVTWLKAINENLRTDEEINKHLR